MIALVFVHVRFTYLPATLWGDLLSPYFFNYFSKIPPALVEIAQMLTEQKTKQEKTMGCARVGTRAFNIS